jgi:hypothetical protein
MMASNMTSSQASSAQRTTSLCPMIEFISEKKSNPCKLIVIKSLSKLYLSGYGNITLLKGKILLNGFTLSKFLPYRFSCPKWLPALDIEISSVTKKTTGSAGGSSISSMLKKVGMEKDFLSIADVSNMDLEGFTVLLLEGLAWENMEWMEAADRSNIIPQQQLKAPIIDCGTCYLFDDESRVKYSIKSLIIPYDWNSTSNQLMRTTTQIKVPVCGAKGSGKSTYMKYLCNRLLAKHRKVCVIDCDLGQPEFTVSGLVSLSAISAPILSPSFMNVSRKPIESYFIGDIITKNNPDYLFTCISLLYARYLSYQLEEEALMQKEQSAKQSINVFEALSEDNNVVVKLPLLINCDGNIRYFGEEVLAALFRIVEPTHIVHVSTVKDPQLRPAEYTASVSSCVVMPISPGQVVPSPIHAIDLRNLRLISYFLGDQIALKKYTSSKTNNASDKTPDGVISISNAAVSDPSGRIAEAMLRLLPYAIPFDSIAFRFLSHDTVSPRLTLAAFNASVVGITSNATAATAFHRFTMPSTNEFSLDIDSIRPDDRASIRPCIGIGIVRVIDISEQTLCLISPALLDGQACLSLLRGSLMLPTSLYYTPDLAIHPFMTAEIHGEGSNTMKPRTNVKRKYHPEA